MSVLCCLRDKMVLVVKTVFRQTEEDGKGDTQNKQCKHATHRFAARWPPRGPRVLPRHRWPSPHRWHSCWPGQGGGAGENAIAMAMVGCCLSLETHAHTHVKKRKKKGGMLLLWDLLLCENGREDTMASKQRGRPTELRVSVLCANYAVML